MSENFVICDDTEPVIITITPCKGKNENQVKKYKPPPTPPPLPPSEQETVPETASGTTPGATTVSQQAPNDLQERVIYENKRNSVDSAEQIGTQTLDKGQVTFKDDKNQNPRLLPTLVPRYHGPGCAMEVGILEKHTDDCSFKKLSSPDRNPLDDKSGSYECIGRLSFKICGDEKCTRPDSGDGRQSPANVAIYGTSLIKEEPKDKVSDKQSDEIAEKSGNSHEKISEKSGNIHEKISEQSGDSYDSLSDSSEYSREKLSGKTTNNNTQSTRHGPMMLFVDEAQPEQKQEKLFNPDEILMQNTEPVMSEHPYQSERKKNKSKSSSMMTMKSKKVKNKGSGTVTPATEDVAVEVRDQPVRVASSPRFQIAYQIAYCRVQYQSQVNQQNYPYQNNSSTKKLYEQLNKYVMNKSPVYDAKFGNIFNSHLKNSLYLEENLEMGTFSCEEKKLKNPSYIDRLKRIFFGCLN